MSGERLVIDYRELPRIERASAKTMATYLAEENAAWTPFLSELRENTEFQFQSYQVIFSGITLASIFDLLKNNLSDWKTFHSINAPGLRRRSVAPPPTSSVEGSLIIGLHAMGRKHDALCAYAAFVYSELNGPGPSRFNANDSRDLVDRGNSLLMSGYAAAALPSHKALTSGLRSAKATAAASLQSLDTAVAEAEHENTQHKQRLTEIRDHISERASRIKRLMIRRERRRSQSYRLWRDTVDAEVAQRFDQAELRLEALDRLAESERQRRDGQFSDLKDLFYTQLRLRAPVALWESRSINHRTQARRALSYFWLSASIAVLVGILVPFLAGNYIADSFTSLRCVPIGSDNCSHVFSAKGPLTLAGILLTTSLILWVTRMQYRIFLSERHLSLDADERRAFAETYMALKEDASVDVTNETIVLASLFRPTQDGIVKDEDGGFDLSAAALIAKQLAR